ncbi:hypothetical protein BC829DRAFT_482970 [Chytridium lagenaria]|nr:hypothetical protein BC829DRAFT_482970 [Chytridium lagenaria]
MSSFRKVLALLFINAIIMAIMTHAIPMDIDRRANNMAPSSNFLAARNAEPMAPLLPVNTHNLERRQRGKAAPAAKKAAAAPKGKAGGAKKGGRYTKADPSAAAKVKNAVLALMGKAKAALAKVGSSIRGAAGKAGAALSKLNPFAKKAAPAPAKKGGRA